MFETYLIGAAIQFALGCYITKRSINPKDTVSDRVFEGLMGMVLATICAIFWPLVTISLTALWVMGIVRREDIKKYKEQERDEYGDWF